MNLPARLYFLSLMPALFSSKVGNLLEVIIGTVVSEL
jgi:hypothetical protein